MVIMKKENNNDTIYGSKYLDEIAKARAYSEETFDKLIVYLSSGGLVLTVGFVKDIIKLSDASNKILLYLTWIGFVLALLSNLLSQKTSKITMDSILMGNEQKEKSFTRITEFCNWSSLILFIVSIILFVLFVLINERSLK